MAQWLERGIPEQSLKVLKNESFLQNIRILSSKEIDFEIFGSNEKNLAPRCVLLNHFSLLFLSLGGFQSC